MFEEEYCRKAIEALKQAVRSYYTLYITCLENCPCRPEELAELRRRIRKLENELEWTKTYARQYKKMYERLLRRLGKADTGIDVDTDNICPTSTADIFISELKEHGLLSLAKKYLSEGDTMITRYLNDDGIFMLHMYAERILGEKEPKRERKPSKMVWIL